MKKEYTKRKRPNSGCKKRPGKQIERCLISTFKVAESMGFKGDFRQWEHFAADW